MSWTEIISNIITQVVQLAIIALIGYIGNFLRIKIKNDKVKKAFQMVEEAAKRAVSVISQTYVDNIKKANNWTIENADEAFRLAIDKAKQSIDEDAKEIVREVTGDFHQYLADLIEAQVYLQKEGLPS